LRPVPNVIEVCGSLTFQTFQTCPFICAVELAFLNENLSRTRSSQQGWWKIPVVGTQQEVLGTADLMFQNTEFRSLSSHC